MASEVRVNKLTNRSGLGTATFNDDGSITVAGNLNLNSVTTTGRNAGVSTAIGAIIYNSTTSSIEGYGPGGWRNVSSLDVEKNIKIMLSEILKNYKNLVKIKFSNYIKSLDEITIWNVNNLLNKYSIYFDFNDFTILFILVEDSLV